MNFNFARLLAAAEAFARIDASQRRSASRRHIGRCAPYPDMARTEVSEADKEISIVAELPGVSQQDVEVSLDDDVLTIRWQTLCPITVSLVGSSLCDTERQRCYS